MPLPKQLGSPSALSLATNSGSSAVEMATSGIALTVAAATFLYKEYKAYRDKKHRTQIEAIKDLHRKHLAKIKLDSGEIRGLPEIFVLESTQDISQAKSMHLLDDEVRSMGEELSHGPDITLSIYRQKIVDAIKKLKSYYFSRKNRNDITSGVISYLLYMLNSKCIHFQGYDYDIAYLRAIANFVNAYASLAQSKKTQHFSRLSPVFSDLQEALLSLEKHKETLSLEEMISELRDACIYESDKLIRDITKIIAKDSEDELVDTVSLNELSKGILRGDYIRTEFKGIVLKADEKKELTKSIFKDWVMKLSHYFLKAIDPNSSITELDIGSPDETFILPDLNSLNELNKNAIKSISEIKLTRKIEKQLKKIRNVFSESPNFITAKLTSGSRFSGYKLQPVSEAEDIISRAKVIADFAILIHQLISLQYLCTHLLKSLKQLGEIYVKNPNHFCKVFVVLDEVCKKIKEKAIENRKIVKKLKTDTGHVMQLEGLQTLPDLFITRLNSIEAKISTLGERVKQYRENVEKKLNIDEATVESVKHGMFEVAGLLATMYHIPGCSCLNDDSIHTSINSDKEEEKSEDKSEGKNEEKEEIVQAQDNNTVYGVMPSKESNSSVARVYLSNGSDLLDNGAPQLIQLDLSISHIFKHILLIQNNEEISPAELDLYNQVYKSLLKIKNYGEQLIKEKNPDSQRKEKIKLTLNYAIQMSEKINEFLQESKETRKAKIAELTKSMHDAFINKDNDFINRHKSSIPKYCYEHWKISIFHTNTYSLFAKINTTVDKLQTTITANIKQKRT